MSTKKYFPNNQVQKTPWYHATVAFRPWTLKLEPGSHIADLLKIKESTSVVNLRHNFVRNLIRFRAALATASRDSQAVEQKLLTHALNQSISGTKLDMSDPVANLMVSLADIWAEFEKLPQQLKRINAGFLAQLKATEQIRIREQEEIRTAIRELDAALKDWEHALEGYESLLIEEAGGTEVFEVISETEQLIRLATVVPGESNKLLEADLEKLRVEFADHIQSALKLSKQHNDVLENTASHGAKFVDQATTLMLNSALGSFLKADKTLDTIINLQVCYNRGYDPVKEVLLASLSKKRDEYKRIGKIKESLMTRFKAIRELERSFLTQDAYTEASVLSALDSLEVQD